MCNQSRGVFIDAPYRVSVHLAKWFYIIRLKCEKLTDEGSHEMAKADLGIRLVELQKRGSRPTFSIIATTDWFNCFLFE